MLYLLKDTPLVHLFCTVLVGYKMLFLINAERIDITSSPSFTLISSSQRKAGGPT